MSFAAFMVNSLAAALAHDLNKPGALERGITKDRKRGPALPSRRLLRRIHFSDERMGPDRMFRLKPVDADRTPLRLMYLHGGAYIHNVQMIQWNLAAWLIKRLGAEVIAPIYPLAPEYSWREGHAAVERIYTSLAEGVGASNIVIFGDSAGGGLALALAQQLRDAGVPLPAALALFSPWLDVSVSGSDQSLLEQRDPVLKLDFLRRAGRLWARDIPLDDPRVSPLFGNHAGLPPTIMFSGSRDVLDSDAIRLAARNPAVNHRHYRNMIHVWPAAPIPEGRQALDEAASFIRQHVGDGIHMP